MNNEQDIAGLEELLALGSLHGLLKAVRPPQDDFGVPRSVSVSGVKTNVIEEDKDHDIEEPSSK